jgi:hypothetical protein
LCARAEHLPTDPDRHAASLVGALKGTRDLDALLHEMQAFLCVHGAAVHKLLNALARPHLWYARFEGGDARERGEQGAMEDGDDARIVETK